MLNHCVVVCVDMVLWVSVQLSSSSSSFLGSKYITVLHTYTSLYHLLLFTDNGDVVIHIYPTNQQPTRRVKSFQTKELLVLDLRQTSVREWQSMYTMKTMMRSYLRTILSVNSHSSLNAFLTPRRRLNN